MFIKDLTPGTLFRLDAPTVYRALGVTVGGPGEGTVVRYCVEGHPSVGEYQTYRPSLSTVYPI